MLFLVVLSLTFMAVSALADPFNDPANPSYDYKGKPYPEINMKDRTSAEQKTWDWSLPFLAQKVIDKGFSLPRPYGLGIIYSHVNQDVNINHLQLGIPTGAPERDINFVDLSGANVDTVTWQAKLDAWILPFLNAFVLLGSAQGTGSVPVAINAGQVFEEIAPGYCSSHASACTQVIRATAPISYTGVNYGLGILVATGFQNFFFAMPVTYVLTNTDVSTENTKSLNLIPRLGYNFMSKKSGKVGVFAGLNYLDSYSTLKGNFALPLAATDIGHDVDVSYKIQESVIEKWIPLAGFNWEIDEFWTLAVELDFGHQRSMQTMNLNYRF